MINLDELTEIIKDRCSGQTWTPKALASRILLSYINPRLIKLDNRNQQLLKEIEEIKKALENIKGNMEANMSDDRRMYKLSTVWRIADKALRSTHTTNNLGEKKNE